MVPRNPHQLIWVYGGQIMVAQWRSGINGSAEMFSSRGAHEMTCAHAVVFGMTSRLLVSKVPMAMPATTPAGSHAPLIDCDPRRVHSRLEAQSEADPRVQI
ncbi:unnamed protein product [Caenorhabditis auriculariae]|uniref:Uncharacterized protein n=1 Tax=Caenorhabditis auriculariae TaxID=2777116 RepID=A0A8S1HIV9_9PELO|nr:unnamed protein product [Caenorhabditis auriculariae]